MWLALFKNPITKMVFNKATEHFKHKAEKVKTIREAEILACKEVDVARIKSQDKSWKDEILLIWLIGMLTTGWFESTRDRIRTFIDRYVHGDSTVGFVQYASFYSMVFNNTENENDIS